jgi:hypothetical protein
MVSSILPSFDFKRSIRIREKDLKNINIEELNNIKEPEKFDEENNNIQPMNKLKYYYIPKCICLLSIHPRIKLFQKILSHIYNYGLSQNVEIPLEKIITNLIIEVPLPPRGLYSINYNYNYESLDKKNSNIMIQSSPKKIDNNIDQGRAATLYISNNNNDSSLNESYQVQPLISTENNKLLVTEIDLNKFDSSLSFKTKMEVIKHILLNSKILFFSNNLTLLTDTIMSFLSLIFPFKYPFQVLSFLQKGQYNFLGSPTPFILGIRQEYNKDFFEENEISLEDMNFFVVDLDSNEEENCHLFSNEEFKTCGYECNKELLLLLFLELINLLLDVIFNKNELIVLL